MKTKITAVLMAMMFFLTISVFADNDTPTKTKILPDCGCGDPIIDDDGNIIDYTMPPWWIGPPESLPDHQ
ncbi:MAG: hypothetical protein C0591_02880 [Marinilabiliales bacterium]|nr:MAG: hypothetical protein C0591_02880 [Marinilabiliales bacterium]